MHVNIFNFKLDKKSKLFFSGFQSCGMGFPWGCCAFFLPTMIGAVTGCCIGCIYFPGNATVNATILATTTTTMRSKLLDLSNNTTRIQTPLANENTPDIWYTLLLAGALIIGVSLFMLSLVWCYRKYRRSSYEEILIR